MLKTREKHGTFVRERLGKYFGHFWHFGLVGGFWEQVGKSEGFGEMVILGSLVGKWGKAFFFQNTVITALFIYGRFLPGKVPVTEGLKWGK